MRLIQRERNRESETASFKIPRLSDAAKRCALTLSHEAAELHFCPEEGRFTLRIGVRTEMVRSETVDVLDRARMLTRKRGEIPAYVMSANGMRFVREMSECLRSR